MKLMNSKTDSICLINISAMNSSLNPHNGTSLTGVIDLTAHSISLFRENEPPQNIKDMFIPYINISKAEAIDVQIDELGNNTIQMYQFIGDINDKSWWFRIITELYE